MLLETSYLLLALHLDLRRGALDPPDLPLNFAVPLLLNFGSFLRDVVQAFLFDLVSDFVFPLRRALTSGGREGGVTS